MLLIIVLTISLFFVLYKIRHHLNNSLLFYPVKMNRPTRSELDEMSRKHGQNISIRDGIIDSSDNVKIHYILLKNDKSNKVFLYSHGNSYNISNKSDSSIIKLLLKHGSVIMYDYRGYGASTGYPTDRGLKDDILAVWNHAISIFHFKEEDIILYGESLGCSLTSWLCSYLSENDKKMPKFIILQSGFYSLKRIVSDLFHPLLSYLIVHDFNNAHYIKKIKLKHPQYKILLIHSKKDELIDFSHAKDLTSEYNCHLLEVDGFHNTPKFDKKSDDIIQEWLSDKN